MKNIAARSPMPSSSPTNSASTQPFQVLVVDDYDDSRDMVALVLKRHGLTVLEATDGVEAIKMAYLNRPDLILMDISMPVMDGLESVRQLKGVEVTRSIPVIVISAHCGDPAMDKRVLDAGCLSCLPKPFDLDELMGVIDGVREPKV
ncbi:response regulator [bacterium]|nr:MAG: response regulator [bacterium]